MFIPSPFNFCPVFLNQPCDLIQLVATEVAGPCKFEGSYPILRVSTTFSNIHMHGLATIEAEKEDTIPSKVMENSGHVFD
jgi:hypothetical protein